VPSSCVRGGRDAGHAHTRVRVRVRARVRAGAQSTLPSRLLADAPVAGAATAFGIDTGQFPRESSVRSKKRKGKEKKEKETPLHGDPLARRRAYFRGCETGVNRQSHARAA